MGLADLSRQLGGSKFDGFGGPFDQLENRRAVNDAEKVQGTLRDRDGGRSILASHSRGSWSGGVPAGAGQPAAAAHSPPRRPPPPAPPTTRRRLNPPPCCHASTGAHPRRGDGVGRTGRAGERGLVASLRKSPGRMRAVRLPAASAVALGQLLCPLAMPGGGGRPAPAGGGRPAHPGQSTPPPEIPSIDIQCISSNGRVYMAVFRIVIRVMLSFRCRRRPGRPA